MRVLIVDDMPLMRGVISHLLRDLECTYYTEAENGQVALNILRKEKFDAVLTDLNMPVMDGIDLVTAMRSDPLLKNIPVLMITAERHKNQVLAAAKAGADGYIIKPFNKVTLHSKINHIIERRNSIRLKIHTQS